MTALHLAILHLEVDAVAVLAHICPSLITVRNARGRTCLEVAFQSLLTDTEQSPGSNAEHMGRTVLEKLLGASEDAARAFFASKMGGPASDFPLRVACCSASRLVGFLLSYVNDDAVVAQALQLMLARHAHDAEPIRDASVLGDMLGFLLRRCCGSEAEALELAVKLLDEAVVADLQAASDGMAASPLHAVLRILFHDVDAQGSQDRAELVAVFQAYVAKVRSSCVDDADFADGFLDVPGPDGRRGVELALDDETVPEEIAVSLVASGAGLSQGPHPSLVLQRLESELSAKRARDYLQEREFEFWSHRGSEDRESLLFRIQIGQGADVNEPWECRWKETRTVLAVHTAMGVTAKHWHLGAGHCRVRKDDRVLELSGSAAFHGLSVVQMTIPLSLLCGCNACRTSPSPEAVGRNPSHIAGDGEEWRWMRAEAPPSPSRSLCIAQAISATGDNLHHLEQCVLALAEGEHMDALLCGGDGARLVEVCWELELWDCVFCLLRHGASPFFPGGHSVLIRACQRAHTLATIEDVDFLRELAAIPEVAMTALEPSCGLQETPLEYVMSSLFDDPHPVLDAVLETVLDARVLAAKRERAGNELIWMGPGTETAWKRTRTLFSIRKLSSW
mmetsp:Transcript_97690/g.146424  ORF Transcript_97690/g.146424 Transcript_97690/m.146424 type:complete len:621 (-) Transcript_97690:2952-4814(-)